MTTIEQAQLIIDANDMMFVRTHEEGTCINGEYHKSKYGAFVEEYNILKNFESLIRSEGEDALKISIDDETKDIVISISFVGSGNSEYKEVKISRTN